MMKRGPQIGVSLLEAIMATFVLVSAFLVVINLFHSGLGHSTRIEKQQFAGVIGARYVEQMRIWSETKSASRYNYENLMAIYGVHSETVPDYAGFTVSTVVTPLAVYSACSSFEDPTPPLAAVNATTNFPLGARKLPAANGSIRSVQVTVAWDQNRNQIHLQTYLCRPIDKPRAKSPIVITPQAATPYVVGSGTLLARDVTGAGLNLTATAFDSNNLPIQDVFFQWDLIPVTGSGTLAQSRDGSLSNVTNVMNVGGVPHYTGGTVNVTVFAKIHGVNVTDSFGPIELAP